MGLCSLECGHHETKSKLPPPPSIKWQEKSPDQTYPINPSRVLSNALGSACLLRRNMHISTRACQYAYYRVVTLYSEDAPL
jgi:hypothetical protein